MKLLKWTTVLFGAIILAASAHAQELTGTLKTTVSSAEGGKK